MTFNNGLSMPIFPFLTAYASQRTGSAETIGYYSSSKEMWVVEVEGKEVPLINYDPSTASIVTKTMTIREEDDDVMNLSELVTKTDAQLERDDHNMSAVLDIATKTEAQLERDDASLEISNLFM